jgi:hypothetical protein
MHAEAHEAFITDLIRRELVLLGGGLVRRAGDVDAAYVLRCGSVDEAAAIAAEEPYAQRAVVVPDRRV